MSDIAIGIDLGTTNSCVALVDEEGNPKIVPGPGGALTTPSIVTVDEKGSLIVGHQAKRRFLTHPQDTIYGAKRLMGRQFGTPEMEDIQSHFFYKIAEGENRTPMIEAGGKQFSLEEVSAMILTQLRDSAQEHLQQRVGRAVISVPAYFTQHQREAVRRAGELADMEVLRIINEPTAAALAYGFGKREQQRILVYDLGGGTFDVTILQLYEEVYEVVGTGGDSFLGGIDFDNRIVQHFCSVFEAQHGIDLRQDNVALQRLRDAAERAKIDLSSIEETEVHLPFLAQNDGRSIDFQYKLNRKQYQDLVKPLVIDSLKIVERVLREAELTKKHVDDVLFVGGMTRTPMVTELVSKYFGKRPRKDVHPDEVVAQGAAILADAIRQGQAAVTLVDVLPVSIGIGVGRGQFRKVINKNTAIPVIQKQVFRTTKDNQKGVAVKVYQGESREVANNEFLGELRLTGFPPRPKGEVQVEIAFDVNEESILKVSARDSVRNTPVEAKFVTEAAVARERYRADQILDEEDGGGEGGAAAGDGTADAVSRSVAKAAAKRKAAAGGDGAGKARSGHAGAEAEAGDEAGEESDWEAPAKEPGFFGRLWRKLTGA